MTTQDSNGLRGKPLGHSCAESSNLLSPTATQREYTAEVPGLRVALTCTALLVSLVTLRCQYTCCAGGVCTHTAGGKQQALSRKQEPS